MECKDWIINQLNLKKLSEISAKYLTNKGDIIGVFNRFSYPECVYLRDKYGGYTTPGDIAICNRILAFFEYNNSERSKIIKALKAILPSDNAQDINEINRILKKNRLYMDEYDDIREIVVENRNSSNHCIAKDGSIEQAIMNDEHIHDNIKELCRKESSGSFAYVYLSYGLMLQMIRDKTGLEDDGSQLIEKTFNKQSPFFLLSKEIESRNGKNEHEGYVDELKGTCKSIRNVLAHHSDSDLHCGDKTSVINTLHLITRLMHKISKARVVPSITRK